MVEFATSISCCTPLFLDLKTFISVLGSHTEKQLCGGHQECDGFSKLVRIGFER